MAKRIPSVRSVNIPEQLKVIEKLISENMGLVGYVVNKLFRQRPWAERLYTFDEAFSDGLQGLLRAAELYEEVRVEGGCKTTITIRGHEYPIVIGSGLSKPVRFPTYACIWIKQFVLRGMERVHLIRVMDKTLKRNGKKRAGEVFMSELHYGNGKEERVELEDPKSTVELNRNCTEVYQTAEKLIRSIPKSYAEVIRLRFYEGLTLHEIGVRLGLTRERIRQIQVEAIKRMRSVAHRLKVESPL